MKNIILCDVSLRDGSHAINHQLTVEQIGEYAALLDQTGINLIEVGHGNGLGASSLQLGLSRLSDAEMIRSAREKIKNSKLGVFITPGFCKAEHQVEVGIDEGADVFRVASHCTEANITERAIKYTKKRGAIAYGALMLSHMATNEKLLEESRKMQDYGADAIVLMDSAGAFMPDGVHSSINYLTQHLKIPLGFHAHNNLGLSIANSLAALRGGATILDGTASGFGGGAGNASIETLVAALIKENYKVGVDLFKLLDAVAYAQEKILPVIPIIKPTNLLSGYYGIVSTFSTHVDRVAKQFNVDYKEIYKELGRRKVVAGQEDFIVEAAHNLKKSTPKQFEKVDKCS